MAQKHPVIYPTAMEVTKRLQVMKPASEAKLAFFAAPEALTSVHMSALVDARNAATIMMQLGDHVSSAA
jgi:hypothetical protein